MHQIIREQYRTIQLPYTERRELISLLDELDELDQKIARHHKSQLSGNDTNPAGDIGGIRSRSQKQKDRIFDRFSREAKQAIALYQARNSLCSRIESVVSGEWMRREVRIAAEQADRARLKRERDERRIIRDRKKAEREAGRDLAAEAADLQSYNDRARAVYVLCEQQRALYRPLRSKDYYNLDSQRASGVQSAWTVVDAEIAGQHMRGERATVAQIITALVKARAAAERHQAEARDPSSVYYSRSDAILATIDARYEAEIDTLDTIKQMFEQGEIVL